MFDWPYSRDLFPGVLLIGTTTIVGHVFLTAAFQTLPIILVSIVITLVPAVQELLAGAHTRTLLSSTSADFVTETP